MVALRRDGSGRGGPLPPSGGDGGSGTRDWAAFGRRVRPAVAALGAALLLVTPGAAQPWLGDGVVAPRRSFIGQPSVDRFLVPFEDGVTRLHVPRNFLIDWRTRESTRGRPHMIGMATVPALAGASVPTIDCFATGAMWDCDVVLFANEQPVASVPDPNRFRWYRLPEERLEPADFGLMHSTRLPESYVYLAPNDADDVTFSCEFLCDTTVIAAGMSWRTRFRKELLPQWRAIMDGVAGLIGTFEAAAKDPGKPL